MSSFSYEKLSNEIELNDRDKRVQTTQLDERVCSYVNTYVNNTYRHYIPCAPIRLSPKFIATSPRYLSLRANDMTIAIVDIQAYPDALRDGVFWPLKSSIPFYWDELAIPYNIISVWSHEQYDPESKVIAEDEIPRICNPEHAMLKLRTDYFTESWDGCRNILHIAGGGLGWGLTLPCYKSKRE